MRRSPIPWLLCFTMLLISRGAVAQSVSALDPNRVLVIYNQNYPDHNGDGLGDSEEVALAYAARRGIPAAHLLAVACSTNQFAYNGLAGWTAFYNEIRTPVVNYLNTNGTLSIDTLLFIHGVPYRLSLPQAQGGARSLDQAMMTPFSLGSASAPSFPTYVSASPYFEGSPGYGSDIGHWDHSATFAGAPFYMAARVDGPDVDVSMNLIEGALYGDKYIAALPGYYQGNIYVDTRFGNYPNLASLPYPQFHFPSYANADQDMAWCTQLMTAFGFPLLWENTSGSKEIGEPGATFQTGAPALAAPNALFYYGWYNYNNYNDVWSWLPGSAACDLDSNSAAHIHNPAPPSFLANAFQRGLTCGVGSIAEPYLNWHPFPEVFIHYLLNGFTFAEAAAASDQTQKWRNLYVGDPLYCPMRSGKPLVIDTTPPPNPTVTLVDMSADSRTYRIAIDTATTDPDLVTATGNFGPAPVLSTNVPADDRYFVAKRVTLDNLTSGVFYRAQLQIVDPAGNTTAVPEILFIHDVGPNSAVAIQSDSAVYAPSQPLTLEVALHEPGGIGQIQGILFTLDAPALGITGLDLSPYVPFMSPAFHGDALQDETFSTELTIPTGLPAGSYTFHVALIDASGVHSASLPVLVQ